MVELARNDEERQVLSAVVNAAEIGTSFFTSPNVPKDRLETLRRAFDATMKDPDFLSEAQKTQLSVGPMPGEELQKLVAEVAAISPDGSGKSPRRLRDRKLIFSCHRPPTGPAFGQPDDRLRGAIQ